MKKLATALIVALLLCVGSVFASPRQNANSAAPANTTAAPRMGRRHHRRHHRRHRRRRGHRRARTGGNTNT